MFYLNPPYSLDRTIEKNRMALLLYVEFQATSPLAATKIIESLSKMADIVHRSFPGVYTYAFRRSHEIETKLIFTEIYENEKAFLEHGRDAEFGKLLLEAFDTTAGKSAKELCIRNDINEPLLKVTANILDHYLHVTYYSLENGFFHRNSSEKKSMELLIVCGECDENVYEQLNTLYNCVTCLTFNENDGNRQLIAVITNMFNVEPQIKEKQPSIDRMEIVCSDGETIEKFKSNMNTYFQIRSLHVQTSFSGYIRHQSWL